MKRKRIERGKNFVGIDQEVCERNIEIAFATDLNYSRAWNFSLLLHKKIQFDESNISDRGSNI